jgi:hypothetical protein
MALALDESKTIHLAFYDDWDAELKYARRSP